MRIQRLWRAERLQHEQLLGRVGEMVLAAHHMRYLRVEVVDRYSEVVEHRAVGASDNGVVEVQVLEDGLAADDVAHDGRAVVGYVQTHGALRLLAPPESTLGAV